MNKFKKIIIYAVASFLFVSSAQLAFADHEIVEDSSTATESAALVEPVDSFELFWPLAAGKTEGDSLYFLKRLKEKARGLIIFGAPQKAEYSVFLTTKRIIEAEKLLVENKQDLAEKTLDSAASQLEDARDKAEASGDSISVVANEVNNKLDNLEVFLAWLSHEYEGQAERTDALLEAVKSLNDRV